MGDRTESSGLFGKFRNKLFGKTETASPVVETRSLVVSEPKDRMLIRERDVVDGEESGSELPGESEIRRILDTAEDKINDRLNPVGDYWVEKYEEIHKELDGRELNVDELSAIAEYVNGQLPELFDQLHQVFIEHPSLDLYRTLGELNHREEQNEWMRNIRSDTNWMPTTGEIEEKGDLAVRFISGVRVSYDEKTEKPVVSLPLEIPVAIPNKADKLGKDAVFMVCTECFLGEASDSKKLTLRLPQFDYDNKKSGFVIDIQRAIKGDWGKFVQPLRCQNGFGEHPSNFRGAMKGNELMNFESTEFYICVQNPDDSKSRWSLLPKDTLSAVKKMIPKRMREH
jgi:hypothetical protein